MGRSRVQRCFSGYKTTECVTGVHNRVTERRTIYLAAEHYQTSYTTITDYFPKKNPLTMACATQTKLPTGICSKGKYTSSWRVRNRNYLNYLLSEFSMHCLYCNQNTLLARNPFWPVHGGGELQTSKASKKNSWTNLMRPVGLDFLSIKPISCRQTQEASRHVFNSDR